MEQEKLSRHTSIGNPGNGDQISMANELLRKTIHLTSISVSVFYSFFSKEATLFILIPVTLISIFFDYGRHFSKNLNRFVNWLFGSILREHERDSDRMLLSGASYVLISAVLCILIFPKIIAITSFSILIVCDTSSALFGRKYGIHPFFDKSREGAMAFIVSGIAVILITPKVSAVAGEYVIAVIAVLVAALIESASTRLRMDDNFSVPLSAGGTLWLGYFILAKLIPLPYKAIFEALIN